MEIITNRLILRNYTPKDVEDLHLLLTDERVQLFTGCIKKRTNDELILYINKINSEFTIDLLKIREKCGNFRLAIDYNGKFVGYVGIEYCEIMENLELLYGIKYDYWGRGIATEAVQAVLNYAFNKMNLQEIYAAVNPKNSASENVLRKSKLQFCGLINWPKQGFVNKYIINREMWLTNASS